MALTKEEFKILCSPFDLNSHSLRDGGNGLKLVYLEEEPIIMRLLQVDPSYELGEPIKLEGKPENISIKISLTVQGVTRWGIGVSKLSSFTGEPSKDAVTDAFKRAARCFGIGLYLKQAKNLKNQSDLKRWLDLLNSVTQTSNPVTNETNIIVTKVNGNKKWYVIEGCVIWSRDCFIELEFCKEGDEVYIHLGNTGETKLSDNVRIVYEEVQKNDKTQKNALRIQRINTEKVYVIKENK